jgi:hypothetical protein
MLDDAGRIATLVVACCRGPPAEPVQDRVQNAILHRLGWARWMMTPRDAASRIRELMRWYPVVAVTGPRQSGKTTLLRSVFPDWDYVNFESPSVANRKLVAYIWFLRGMHRKARTCGEAPTPEAYCGEFPARDTRTCGAPLPTWDAVR